MTAPVSDRLYRLLPAIYRTRDVAQTEPLRTLLGIVERELNIVEEDIAGLYDNWFIETCDEWVVPYVGDLLGARGLDGATADAVEEQRAFSLRARVANTVSYRRRKGTVAMLEQLARDTTGWPARAVEFFERLATTQYVNHLRPARGGTVDLRDANALELLDGPFEQAAHTADVRAISDGLGLSGGGAAQPRMSRGKYNIPNVGLFLWRLEPYPVERSLAGSVGSGLYTFDPLGRDAPLFNRPRTEGDPGHLAEERNVPGILRPRALSDELREWRGVYEAGGGPVGEYFASPEVLRVFLDDDLVPAQEIVICDLSTWGRPVVSPRPASSFPRVPVYTPRVAVDPVRGRLTITRDAAPSPPVEQLPARVEVSYAYGFSGDLGGGPYDRRASLASWLQRVTTRSTPVWQIGVTANPVAPAAEEPTRQVATLQEAVALWNATPADTIGIISIMDSRTYAEDLKNTNGIQNEIRIAAGSHLLIIAAEWPKLASGSYVLDPDPRQLIVSGLRPLVGAIDGSEIQVRGTAKTMDAGSLTINGLVVNGKLVVLAGNLGGLHLVHSTLVPGKSEPGKSEPGKGELVVQATGNSDDAAATTKSVAPVSDAIALVATNNERLVVAIERSITGRVKVPATVSAVIVRDSILDNPNGVALAAGDVSVQTSTVMGRTTARTLSAGNSIFTGKVSVQRRQTGCVRFCYLPRTSTVPQRYRCQPASAALAKRVIPQFTAALYGAAGNAPYGEPGYAQLALSCPAEILIGAEDEGEMGAFHFLQQSKRLANLRASLDEYLRFGLEAGIFLVT
jgi:hypothetical protein